MKKENFKKLFKGMLITVLLITPVIISSCYYDYGLETDNYDVVGTFYNTDYNFQNVTKYYLIDQVVKAGGGNITNQYDDLILQTTRTNLNNLGWTEVTDSSQADVILGAGVTTTTNVVETGSSGCWYDYWGYSWCYPSYSYTYTYTTGTILLLMTDLRTTTGGVLPAQWNAIINGLAGSSSTGNVPQRITTAINKAFEQSPYLR